MAEGFEENRLREETYCGKINRYEIRLIKRRTYNEQNNRQCILRRCE